MKNTKKAASQRRIIIDARESGTSTGRYVDKLIENLHDLDPEYDITVLTKSNRLKYINSIAPNFKAVKSDYNEFSFAEQLGLAWQLYRLKADLVHFGMTHQPILYFGKTVTTVHDLTTVRFNNPTKFWLLFKFKQLVYKLVVRVVARKSKALIVPSRWVKQDLVSYTRIDPKKVTVTYEAADKITDHPQKVSGLDGQKFIIYVGRPMTHKNLKNLIDAFNIAKIGEPDLKLVMVGKTDKLYKNLRNWTDQRSIDGVVFTGFVSDGQLRWLYEHARAYVFPSLSEGFGLPGLEAMAHGLPVLASKATSLPEVYKDGAIYFDPEEKEEIATMIVSILADRDLAAKIAAKGEKVAAGYSWQKMARQSLDVYTKILNK